MVLHRFLVEGTASPDLPLRVLNLFAQQGLAIDTADIRRDGDRYVVRVGLAGLTPQRAGVIVERIRMMVAVERASLIAEAPAPFDRHPRPDQALATS